MNIEPLEARIAPATFIVNTLLDDPTGDDLLTLREAVALANGTPAADTIKFAPEVVGRITLFNGEIVISETLTILGGGKITLSGNDASRIFRVDHPDTLKAHPLTVSGLRFVKGVVGAGESGGAIASNEGLTIIGCTFDQNEAGSTGGAVSVFGGTVTVKDSHFNDNVSGSVGGGLSASSAKAIAISGSVFIDNSAVGGGGAHLQAQTATASVKVTGSTFTHNVTTTSGGGGLMLAGAGSGTAVSKFTITKSQVVENSAGGVGGGIRADTLALTLAEVLVSGNGATGRGGGVAADGSPAFAATKSVFAGNVTGGADGGGGVFLGGSAAASVVTFALCQFVDNEATSGPGGGLRIADTADKLTISGSQFVGNLASTSGGGLSINETAAGASAALTGNRFIGNEAVDYGGLNVRYDGGTVVLKNNVVAGNEASGGVGGANVIAGTELTLSGNTIAGNRAADLNGGLFLGVLDMDGTFSLSGDRIVHNELTGNGAAGVLIGAGGAGVTGAIGKNVRISGNIANLGTGGVDTDSPGVTLLAVVTGNLVRNDVANPQTSGTFVNTPPTPPILAADFLVTDPGDSGPGTLRDAIAQANATPKADKIAFDPMVTSITLASEIDVTETLTILGRGLVTISGNDATRLFDVSNADDARAHSLTLNGLILVNGKTTGVDEAGGAIRSTEGLTLIDCIFADNASGAGGGAIFVDTTTGALTIKDSHIAGNTSVFGGGGVFADVAKTIAISGSVFAGNVGGSGAGVFLRVTSAAGKLTMANSHFVENQATGVAGGAALDGTLDGKKFTKLAVSAASFVRNTATTDGGGLNLTDGAFTLTDVALHGNSAGHEGGGFATGAGLRQLAVAKSLFAANTAASTLGGGGAYLGLGATGFAASISASSFFTNKAINGNGGGLFADTTGGKVTVSASLFADNEADAGGGLAAHGTGSNSPVVVLMGNTIAGNETSLAGGVSLRSDAAITMTKNLLAGNFSSGNNTAAGAFLSSLGKITLSANSVLGNDGAVGGLWIQSTATTASFSLMGGLIASNKGSIGGVFITQAISGIIAKSAKITGNIAANPSFAGGVSETTSGTVTLLATVLGNLHRTVPAQNETTGTFAP